MSKIENKFFAKMEKKMLKRTLSLVITVLLFLAFLSFVGFVIVPQLSKNVIMLTSQVQNLVNSASGILNDLPSAIKNFTGMDLDIDLAKFFNSFYRTLANVLNSVVSSAGGYIGSIFSGLYSFFMALILAIYILLSKESIAYQLKRFADTYLSKKIIKRLNRYGRVLNKSFEVFVIGQIMEGMILGVLCYLLMLIFGFQYPLVIGFMVGITNIIPIIGPYIGAIPSFFLLLAINPTEALFFIPFILILQQIEGNIIYPRVVGDAMGISGFWIMIVVIICNGFFGVPGILIGIPLFASIYVLIKENIEVRGKIENIEAKGKKENANVK